MSGAIRFCFLSVMFLIVSCGGGGSNNDVSSDSQIDLELDGTWVSNCYFDSDDGEYIIDTFVFLESSVVASFNAYNNSSCSNGPILSGNGSGIFSVGNEIDTEGGLEAFEIDFNIVILGHEVHHLDIIRVNGDEFNFGIATDDEARPTQIDFDITFTIQ